MAKIFATTPAKLAINGRIAYDGGCTGTGTVLAIALLIGVGCRPNCMLFLNLDIRKPGVMTGRKIRTLKIVCALGLATTVGLGQLHGQQNYGPTQLESTRIASHEWVLVRLNIERPIERRELVTETAYDSREVTRTRPTWVYETHYRTVTRRVPVEQERTIQQTTSVEKPVIETAFEERVVTQTVMRSITDTEQQRHVVQRPVQRTEYRDETVVVEKPVEQTYYQTENVTTWRPVTQTQTVYKQGVVPVTQQVPANTNPSLDWQRRGYYTNPATGEQVWRRPGFYWTKSPETCQVQTNYVPTLIPEQQTSTAYVPETVQQYKPVVVAGTTRTYETRKVPVTVDATESVVEYRDVPVTRYEPVTETRTEKVPVNRLRYETQTTTRDIPIRETVYETVTEEEPYQVRVMKEVSETSTERVPRKVERYVTRHSTERVVRNVYVSVPLDENDRRTIELDREMTVRLDNPTARIPAEGAVVELDFLRQVSVMKPATERTEPVATETSTPKTSYWTDFEPVKPRPGTTEGTGSGGKSTNGPSFEPGSKPDDSIIPADKAPTIGT